MRAWHETYGLPTLVTNCSNNYGPYHFPEKLIPHMIIKGLAGEPLPVYGDGKNVRDWLYVEDHASALALVLERGAVGETYNIGGRNERTNLARGAERSATCSTTCAPSPRRPAPAADHLRHRPAGPRPALRHRRHEARARARLAAPRRPSRPGIEKTVRWYLDQRGWWQAILDRGYTRERLGLIQTPTSQPSREPAT